MRSISYLAAAACGFVLLALPTAARAQTTIDFDSASPPCVFSSTTALRNAYAALGVTFTGPGPLDGGAILGECGGFSVSGHSAPNFLAFNCGSGMMGGGNPCGPETMTFSPPASLVRFNAGSSSAGTVTATAYDPLGGVVATAVVGISSSVTLVEVSGANIETVVFNNSGSVFIVDDLYFENASDADGDGFAIADGDCDDGNPAVYPGAPEICDGLDDDCDGVLPPDEADVDADGVAMCAGDCDDTDATRYPGAMELCDGLDNDCDAVVPADESDGDADGVTECAGDCDDSDPARYPGAPEGCDGLDTDCDGSLPVDESDGDGDGFMSCEGDCDDIRDDVYPGAPELCDFIDNDCSGTADDADADMDGFDACGGDCDDSRDDIYPGAPELCDFTDNDCNGTADDGDSDGDGSTACGGDCDDTNAAVWPGAPEICIDGLDNDCDGLTDTQDPSCQARTGCSCRHLGNSPSPLPVTLVLLPLLALWLSARGRRRAH